MLRRIAEGTEDWVNRMLQSDEKPRPERLLAESPWCRCKANALELEGVLQGSFAMQNRAGSYFSVFTYSAAALASSAERPPTAFLCGAFLASSPFVSRSVI